ncbi:uncharacterized protein LOC111289776 isoform X2 [Durio zibethinus]|uniref:Uncharacterized protein LOC111289776 isoform X2 n=1 Tax=Durio zibethinus TaxID=66656 RepID=A0A6P5YA00_DURZI|nr:uncharacterized protein LOC111289776 isoform X2 [Durio zibethinus]
MPGLSKNTNSSARLSADSAEAERRLREAEERLREAIEELQRRQRTAASGDEPPCNHADNSCVANAIGNLCQSFLLSYGVRVGIGILLRAFKLARGQSYSSLLDLKQLVSEKDLIVREEACRIGLLFGGFTGAYHALRCLLRKLRKKETPVNAILAGSIAGLSILALDDSNRRRTLALYLLARVAQCAYNSAKSKNKFHLWGSHWRHGDSLLFALACAQVMYAFVMRPESLPKSYQDFIQKTGPVAAPVYKAVRENCRGGPVNVASLSAYLYGRGKSNNVMLEEFPSIIPCSVIHPDTSSCLGHNAKAASATFRKTFPLYFSLTFVPFVVLHLQKVALFCACMGGIMYYLEYEPDTMAPFLRGLIRRFLSSKISNSGPSANGTASYNYLQTLDAMKKTKLLDNREVETTTPKQYNLESIQGL